MDIASLYQDIRIRHGLTLRLKLESVRHELGPAETAPATRDSIPISVGTMPCPASPTVPARPVCVVEVGS